MTLLRFALVAALLLAFSAIAQARCESASLPTLFWEVTKPHLEVGSDKEIIGAAWEEIKFQTAVAQATGDTERVAQLKCASRRLRPVLRRILKDIPQRPIDERTFKASARKYLSSDCRACAPCKCGGSE